MIADFRDLLAAFVATDVRFLVVGAPLAGLNVAERDFSRPDQVVQFGLPPYRSDVMTSVSGLVFQEAWHRRAEGLLFEVPVAFLGRDDLILNKRASGRPKDLRDIEDLGGGA